MEIRILTGEFPEGQGYFSRDGRLVFTTYDSKARRGIIEELLAKNQIEVVRKPRLSDLMKEKITKALRING